MTVQFSHYISFAYVLSNQRMKASDFKCSLIITSLARKFVFGSVGYLSVSNITQHVMSRLC